MKSILFVINTMGMGGGEKSILELLKRIDRKKYEVSLFVLTGQGELINQVPEEINILNKYYFPISVLDRAGKTRLIRTVIKSFLIRGNFFKRFIYIVNNLWDMIKKGKVKKDKLLWKIISDGAQRTDKEYDLAVAYLEGGATYYVASHVKAKKKAAFIHTNYKLAGYNRKLDEDCYLDFDSIFTVTDYIKADFLTVYPECRGCTRIFRNYIDKEKILSRSRETGGFSDNYSGFRILTVGRLVSEKAHDVEIRTMKILKNTGKLFRWYVLGEGELRKKLEEQIHMYGLEKDFILLGTVANPFPYYTQCDLYVHAAHLEGKSIAIEEAQILGCAILVSDYSGVQEQVRDGVDGCVCRLEPEALAESILDLANNPQKRAEYSLAASNKKHTDKLEGIDIFLNSLI